MTDTYVISDATGKATIIKDPLALLDYTFDWTDWLAEVADTIASAVITITGDDGVLTENSHTITAGKMVVVWLAAGTVGLTYKVDCKITCTVSTPARIDSRSIYVKMKDR